MNYIVYAVRDIFQHQVRDRMTETATSKGAASVHKEAARNKTIWSRKTVLSVSVSESPGDKKDRWLQRTLSVSAIS